MTSPAHEPPAHVPHEPDASPVADDESAQVVEAFDYAQRMAIRLMRDTLRAIEPGMTEWDVCELAKTYVSSYPFVAWLHEPEVLFDGRAPGLRYRADHRRKLEPGMLVEIDFAPATEEAFADFGHAFVFGGGEEPALLSEARELIIGCIGFSNRFKCTGEVFVFAHSWANNHRLTIGDARSIGHRCFPPGDGWKGAMWPLAHRLANGMKRHQVQWYNPRRMSGIYALRPRLLEGDRGVAFEEMIWVGQDGKRVLGRESEAEVGTL